MQRASTLWSTKRFAGLCGLLMGIGGCLPDGLFSDTAGEIVNGLIISAVEMALSGAGIPI